MSLREIYYQDFRELVLVPASTDERLAAESVLECVRGCRILVDKGFIGGEWRKGISQTTGNQIFTPKRANQLQPQPKAFEGLLNSLRERVEGVFNEVQNPYSPLPASSPSLFLLSSEK
ncbi:hypothetical protein WKK05_13795 [Nostoc sp. UHCC 0302]|uniref:hypothetical protein n=1 Tax=Nostoc sp. UHCC 0302 TaxID=3134896 RepID=UPI00311CDD08